MSKAVSPVVGFNDNVRRRNRNFHVQTEDSGLAHPHIITHLFTDGGRVIKSVRQSYVELVDAEDVSKQVRERMKLQHSGMLEALKRGEYDALVWGNRVKPAEPTPTSAAKPAEVVAPVVKPVEVVAPSAPEVAAPPRRSTPQPAARKTHPRIDTSAALVQATRKSTTPKRRTSRPPARALSTSLPAL